jgi:hypothetical protein
LHPKKARAEKTKFTNQKNFFQICNTFLSNEIDYEIQYSFIANSFSSYFPTIGLYEIDFFLIKYSRVKYVEPNRNNKEKNRKKE